MLDEFELPASLSEAIDRRLRLIAEIEEIEAQLGDRDHGAFTTTGMPWKTWRRKAMWARARRLQELRWINQQIRELTNEQIT